MRDYLVPQGSVLGLSFIYGFLMFAYVCNYIFNSDYLLNGSHFTLFKFHTLYFAQKYF